MQGKNSNAVYPSTYVRTYILNKVIMSRKMEHIDGDEIMSYSS